MKTARIYKLIRSLKVGDWSFSDEREFVENLFVGRFNFFLIIFSLFMTAGFANAFAMKYVVFFVGALILFCAWLPLYRGYKKHDRILKIIFGDKLDHPANQLKEIMQLEGFNPKYRVSRWMGIYIPWLCIVVLLGLGTAIYFRLLN